MNPSPLRYPGGKCKLYSYVSQLIEINGCTTYIEPFCGGAALAISLLERNQVKRIILNDYDYTIYCLWDSILNNTNEFIDKIRNCNVSISEWRKQKDIRLNIENHSKIDIGFSTFFLNRTNRSGIIDKAGPIGGYNQEGDYKVDCRFNKDNIINKIENIASYKKQIKLYNLEALDFIDNVILKTRSSFTFFDPPYYNKGHELYTNFYSHGDHVNLSRNILTKMSKRKWIVTYDNVNEIRSMYKNVDFIEFELKYSLQTKKTANEIMFFSKTLNRPAREESLISIINENGGQ